MGQSSSKIDASMPFASVEYDERDEDEATDSLVCSQSSLFHKTQSLSHTVDDTDTPCAWMHLLNDIQYVDRTYYPSSDELLRPLPPLPRLCDYPSSSTSSVNSSIPTSLVQRAYSSLSLSPSSPLPVRHPLTTATTHTLTMADLQQQDKHLQTIHLAHQNLTTLSANIGLFTMIRRLNLSNNQLTRLPESIGYLQQLESLSLQDNRLTCLPDTLGYLVGLVELDVSRNQLTRLPSSLGYLDKLQSLHAGHNGIRDLPVQMVSGLRTLVILDVSHNPISVLPAEITQLHFLRRLILDGCPLEAIIHHSTMHPADASSSLTLPLPPMPLSPLVRANSASSLSQNRFITSRALPLLPPSASDANLGDNDDENDVDSDNMDHQHQHNAHAYSLRHNPPSLREQCARQIVRQNLHVDDALPEHLVRYLQTATPCTLCRSPYFDTYVRRGRWIDRGNRWIPLEYRLCKAHFSTQQDRLLYLFSQEQLPTLTSPYMQPYRASLPEITRDPPPRPATPNNNAAPPAKFRSHRMKVMNRNQSGFLSLSKLQVAG